MSDLSKSERQSRKKKKKNREKNVAEVTKCVSIEVDCKETDRPLLESVRALKHVTRKYLNQDSNSFSEFGHRLALQLSEIPLDEALSLQLDFQRMITSARLRSNRIQRRANGQNQLINPVDSGQNQLVNSVDSVQNQLINPVVNTNGNVVVQGLSEMFTSKDNLSNDLFDLESPQVDSQRVS